METIWEGADIFCLLIFSTLALVIATFWLWKNGILRRVNNEDQSVTDNLCPEKKDNVLHLNSLESIREILLQKDTSFHRIALHGKVLSESELDLWQSKETLPLRVYLQSLTSERRTLLKCSLAQFTSDLIHQMVDLQSEPRDLSEILLLCSLNFSCQLVLGTNYDFDPLVKKQMMIIVERWPDYKVSLESQSAPKENETEFAEAKEKLQHILTDIIVKRKSNWDHQAQYSYIEHYFANSNEVVDHTTLSKQLVGFFMCCSETMKNYILSTLRVMSDNPDVQEKMQAELKELSLEENLVTLWIDHRDRVPFSQAILMEVLRLNTPVPNVFRLHNSAPEADKTNEKICVANLKNVLQDPKDWKDANEFNLTRFLDNEKKVISKDAFIPFALGEHSCSGQEIALISSFVAISSILRKFHLKRAGTNDNEEHKENQQLHVTVRQ